MDFSFSSFFSFLGVARHMSQLKRQGIYFTITQSQEIFNSYQQNCFKSIFAAKPLETHPNFASVSIHILVNYFDVIYSHI